MQKTLQDTTNQKKPSQSQTNKVSEETERILEEIRFLKEHLKVLQDRKINQIINLDQTNRLIETTQNKIKQLAELPAKIKENTTKKQNTADFIINGVNDK